MEAGDTIAGKYELLRRIGEGGMGVVFEARHVLLDRRVALKFLHGALTLDAESNARFLREAQAAAGLGSDHIVQVLDVGTTEDGSPYLVMELLEGPDLKDVVVREKGLAPRRAADFAAQLCDGIGAAHSKGIVHRDLKPENIIVTRVGDGSSERLKVLDFGIAKFKDIHLTATGSVLGSPSYMAPEQARGAGDVDHRADVYAVGAILFEMITGRPPYTGRSMTEILVKVVTEPPPAPRALRADVPEELERIVLRAMARDREARYQGMEQLARDLKIFLAAAPAAEPAPTVEHPPAPAAGAPEPPAPATTAPPAPTARPRRHTLALVVGLALASIVVLSSSTVVVCRAARRGVAARELVVVSPGSFVMGNPQDMSSGFPGGLQVAVTRPFELSRAEITQRQFRSVMGYDPSAATTCGRRCPVESVTWHEAAAFSNTLSRSWRFDPCYSCTGSGRSVSCVPATARPQDCRGFRLPTEAEWELAARAGTATFTPEGDVAWNELQCETPAAALVPIAWYCGTASNRPHRVRSLRPNRYGLYDMLGNVSEWCNDWFGPVHQVEPFDPPGPTTGTSRVIRGGSFADQAGAVGSGVRGNGQPHLASPTVGFRIARTRP